MALAIQEQAQEQNLSFPLFSGIIKGIEQTNERDCWQLLMTNGSFGKASYRSPWLTVKLAVNKYKLTKLTQKKLAKMLWSLLSENKTLPVSLRYVVTNSLSCFLVGEKYIAEPEKDRKELLQDIHVFLSEMADSAEGINDDETSLSDTELTEMCHECDVDYTQKDAAITIPLKTDNGIFHAELKAPSSRRMQLQVVLFSGSEVEALPIVNGIALCMYLFASPIRLVRPVLDDSIKHLILEVVLPANADNLQCGLSALATACDYIAAESELLVDDKKLAQNYLKVLHLNNYSTNRRIRR